MSFKSMTPALELCLKFLEGISELSGRDLNRVEICAKGLNAILACLEDYDNRVISSDIFCTSFAKNIAEVNAALEGCGNALSQDLKDQLLDLTFQLVEDMAVIMREKYLCGGCSGKHEGEKLLMDYFETCGLWHFGDHTMVTDHYFVGLPIAVMHSLSARLN